MYAKWKQYQYYILIAVISLIVLFVVPLFGSGISAAWVLPTTSIGWFLFISTKLAVAALNFMILHCFILQGKTNILSNERYLAATKILLEETRDKDLIPLSPRQWHAGVYGKKGITLFITSLLSTFCFSQAVLSFDVATMLTYLGTIICGVISGILAMNNEEIYWTETYYQYAIYKKEQIEEAERIAAEKAESAKTVVEMPTPQVHQSADDTTSAIGGSDLLVSSDSSGIDGPNN